MGKSGGGQRRRPSSGVAERLSPVLARARTLRTSLETVERQSRGLPRERATLMSPDGYMLDQAHGTHDAVDLRHLDAEQARGAILTHNHPSGGSFSLADVEYAAHMGLREMRAVGKEYRYSIKAGKQGWSPKIFWERILPSFEKNDQAVSDERRAAVISGAMTMQEANGAVNNHYHDVWLRVARETGLSYRRVAWRQTPQERAAAAEIARMNAWWAAHPGK